MLFAQADYKIRQNCFECSSPFMDVDFLEYVFSIPFELRKNHRIYLKWIKEKYPQATKFGWEKWLGVRPLELNRWRGAFRKFLYLSVNKLVRVFLADEIPMNMSPHRYWIKRDKVSRTRLVDFFEKNYNLIEKEKVVDDQLLNDVRNVFYKGNYIEKSQAITVVEMIRKMVF